MLSELTNSSDSEDEERKYYFELRKFFDDDCTILLRSLLEEFFPEYTTLLQNIPREAYETNENPEGIITKKHQHILEKEGRISKKFKLDLLCTIFQTGVCDECCGRPSSGWHNNDTSFDPQSTGDDILKLLQIWRQYLSDEDTEDISKKDNEIIWRILLCSAERLCIKYPLFGKKFFRSVEKKLTKNDTGKFNQTFSCSFVSCSHLIKENFSGYFFNLRAT